MKERIVWIDLLRIIGMIGIIFIHIVGNTINTYHLDSSYTLFYHCVEKICYFAIPLFVMISGMYFLNKDIPLRVMYRKYCFRIFNVLIVFGSFYSLLELYFTSPLPFLDSIKTIFKNLLTGNLWAHMWYLYLILGLYLVTPFLRKLVKNLSGCEMPILLLLLYLFSFAIPEVNHFLTQPIAFWIPLSSSYLFYYLYGSYIVNFNLTKCQKNVIILLGMLSIFYIIISTLYQKEYLPISYTSTPVFLVANMVFILLKNKKWNIPNILKKGICSLGTCSFGIYIIHQFYINILYKVLSWKWILGSPFLGLFLYTGVVLVLSYLTVYLLKKIPLVSRYLF